MRARSVSRLSAQSVLPSRTNALHNLTLSGKATFMTVLDGSVTTTILCVVGRHGEKCRSKVGRPNQRKLLSFPLLKHQRLC